jgi:hypothetical protein
MECLFQTVTLVTKLITTVDLLRPIAVMTVGDVENQLANLHITQM